MTLTELLDSFEKMLNSVETLQEARVGVKLIRAGFMPGPLYFGKGPAKPVEPGQLTLDDLGIKKGAVTKLSPSRDTKRWSAEEIVNLVVKINQGHNPGTLSADFKGRTPEACKTAAYAVENYLKRQIEARAEGRMTADGIPEPYLRACSALIEMGVMGVRNWRTRQSPKARAKAND